MISNPSGGGGPAPTLGNASVSTTITTAPVNPPSIALSAQPGSIAESAGETEVTITAVMTADQPLPWDTEIVLSLSGTASSTVDYAATTTSVVIPANGSSGTSTLIIAPVDNPLLDGSKTVVVEGSAVGVSSVSPATVTITDDDQAAVTLSTDSPLAPEGSSVRFDVRLSHPISSEVTVSWTATGADAGDYSPTSGSVSFPANSRAGVTQSFTIDITDDDYSEILETVRVALSQSQEASQLGVVVNTTPVAVLVEANDPIVVTISPPVDRSGTPLDPVVEGDASGAYTVSIDNTPTADLSVDYATSDVTAVAGSDYTSATGTLTFTQTGGLKAQSFIIDTIEDQLTEGSEFFRLALSNPRGGGGPAPALPATSSLDVEIDDDDFAYISIQTRLGQVDEGGTAEFRVTLSKQVNADVTVNWSAAGADPGDYSPTFGSVTFPANSPAGTVMTIAIDIADDSLTEPAETFTVTLDGFSSTLTSAINILGTANSADATIGESDPITVSLSGPRRVGVNGQANYRVSLDKFPAADLTVSYATADGTAVAGTDYTARSGVLTFGLGETVKTVSVPVGSSGGGKNFTFSILSPRGGGGPVPDLADPSTITTSIVTGFIGGGVPERKRFTLSAVPNLVVEDAGATSVTVTAILDSSQTLESGVSINVGAYSGGTAEEGVDYTFVPTSGSTITVGASATSSAVTYTLTPVDDGVAEGDETIVVRGASSDDLEVADGSITLTDPRAIQRTPPTAMSLSVNPVSITEGATTTDVTVTATLAGTSTLPTATVVTLSLGGTAALNTDYTASTLTSVTIPADSSSGSVTLTVTPTDDTLIEGDETIVVSGTASGFTVSDATITLTDDDSAPTAITLGVNPSGMTEGAGTTTVTVSATLVGGGTLASDTVVTLTLGGTATPNTDYTASALTSVTIPAGRSSGTDNLTIVPTDDSVVEGDETITVSGTSGTLTVATADVTITDDDSAELSISGPASEVAEGADADFSVTLSHSVASDVEVAWSATPDTAEASDYGTATGTVTFGAGSAANSTQAVAIRVTDDSLSEPDETFSVGLGTITSALSHRVSVRTVSSSADAVISESDPITVSVRGPPAVDEGETSTYTVSLSPIGVMPTQDLTVDYVTSDGTATAGFDYTSATGTLRFTQGDHADKTFTVQTAEDSLSEGEETFAVSISNLQGGGGSAPGLGDSSATTTITDDDGTPMGVTLSVSPSSLAEGDAATAVTLTATLNGTSTLPGATVVTLTLGGTATQNTDYTTSALTSVTIPAGRSSGTATLTVTPTDDSVVEGDETVTVSGTSGTLTVAPADVSITDDDSAEVSIAEPASEVAEGTDAVFTVSLSTAVAAEVSVSYATGDVTALAGSDYTASSSEVTFMAGSAAGVTTTIAVPVTDDHLSEIAESFTVTLGTVGGDLSSRVAVRTASSSVDAVISESDPITVSVSGPLSVNEGATSTYTVSLSPIGVMPTQDLTVDYVTSDGTATAGFDYTSATGTLRFTQGYATLRTDVHGQHGDSERNDAPRGHRSDADAWRDGHTEHRLHDIGAHERHDPRWTVQRNGHSGHNAHERRGRRGRRDGHGVRLIRYADGSPCRRHDLR